MDGYCTGFIYIPMGIQYAGIGAKEKGHLIRRLSTKCYGISLEGSHVNMIHQSTAFHGLVSAENKVAIRREVGARSILHVLPSTKPRQDIITLESVRTSVYPRKNCCFM